MKMFRHSVAQAAVLAATVLAAAWGAGAADAASVTLSSVTGSWDSAEDGKDVAGIGTSQIRWGTPTGNGPRSGYGFEGTTAAPAEVQAGKAFALGTFTHYNRVIQRGGGISGAELSVDIGLRIGGEDRTITSLFDFDHLETLNQAATCGNGGGNGTGVNASGCADRVTAVTNLGQSDIFVIDGQTYQFTITSFEGMTEFWTQEQADNAAMLYGMFVQIGGMSPVPLPAAALLMGTGLVGLGMLRARRR